MESKSPIWKKIIAVILLWVMAWVGGSFIVSILNQLAPLLFWRDTQQAGSFGFAFLTAISGAVGVVIGANIMNALTDPKEYIFRMINYVVLGTAVAAILAVMFFVGHPTIVTIIQMGLVVAACVAYALSENADMKTAEKKKQSQQ